MKSNMATCIKNHKNDLVIPLLGIHPKDIIEEKQKANMHKDA